MLVQLRDQFFKLAWLHMTAKLGANAARMHSNAANAPVTPAPVEFHCEQHVRRLRAPVRDPRIVIAAIKVWIFDVDIAAAMAGRGEAHKATARAQQRCDLVHEHEVPEVIGAELRFKPVFGFAKRRGHHASIGDNDIERLAFGEQFVRRRAHTLQRREVKFDQLKRPAIARIFAHLRRGALGLLQIPRRADHISAARRERPRRLNTEPGRDAGHHDALA